MTNGPDLAAMQREAIHSLAAQTLRMIKQDEARSESLQDRAWFPWVAVAAAVGVGAVLGRLL